MQLKDRLLVIDKMPISGIKIVGYNLLAVIFYTIIYALLIMSGAGEEGIFIDFCLIVIQVTFCVLMAFTGKRSGAWPLSGVLVFVTGFITIITIGLGLMGGV